MFSRSPRRRRRALGVLLGLSVAAGLTGCGGGASHAAVHNYYLALGDSLSVGIQPNAQGRQLETDQGYTNDIAATLARRIPRLKLVEMGCPGDASLQVLTGQGNATAARAYRCDRTDGSQLNAGLAFIRAHGSRVKVITVDIGANDLNACITATALTHGLASIASCVTTMERTIAANLPKIFGPLKSAAAPGTRLVAGEIYDPFLVGLLSPSATLRTVARDSVAVVNGLNREIAAAAAKSGFRTADVSRQFATDDATQVRVPRAGQSLPRSLVTLCALTYLCTSKPRGPNIHPNAAGYRAIARAFEQQMPGL